MITRELHLRVDLNESTYHLKQEKKDMNGHNVNHDDDMFISLVQALGNVTIFLKLTVIFGTYFFGKINVLGTTQKWSFFSFSTQDHANKVLVFDPSTEVPGG